MAIALSDQECDEALRAIGRFVDLKSPFTVGHSLAVAELAAAAGRQLGLPDDQVHTLYRAGLVHDFGRLGVSNSIWDKRARSAPASGSGSACTRTSPSGCSSSPPTLAPLGRIAVQHRERLDGSGYPRGLTGNAISPLARILGAADAYQAMREPRPHRPPRTADDAAPSCGPRCGRAGSTPTRSRRCSSRPVIASSAAARARPG